MFRLTRALAQVAVVAVAVAGATLPGADVSAAPPSESVEDQFAGQILFVDVAPPRPATADWYTAHKVTQRTESADKKWSIHMVIFLRAPLEKPRLPIAVSKTSSRGEPVQRFVFFPTGDARVHYFALSLAEPPFVANGKYRFRASNDTTTLAEGSLELLPAPVTPAIAFDAEAAQDALMKVLYQDCKAPGSAGGDAKLLVAFAAKDGSAIKVDFAPKPPVPYSAATQACIVKRFRTVRVKEFGGADRVVPFVITVG